MQTDPGSDAAAERSDLKRRAREVASRLEGRDFGSRDELRDELNGDSDVADLVYVEVHNLNDLERFRETDGRMAVFLPHCLRDVSECLAERTGEGYDCKLCMSCEIGEIESALGGEADVYMVPGGGIIRRILGEKDYAAVVGVACFPELELGKKLTGSIGVPVQMIPLEEDGCQDTSVDIESVVERAG